MIARLLEELNSGKTTERKVAAFPVPSEGNTVEMVDPISALIERRRAVEGAKPAALVALQIEVTINGGLALVETTRSYTNNEAMPIETLLSLPVPVHAAFFGLTARIGGRLHKAVAMAKEEARETYESAIDEGRAAVLHEELLRGVHALSVANLAPGTQAEVTTRWTEPLRFSGPRGRLRIPLTVGDVYGLSGLQETDELAHGGPVPSAMLRVRHDAEAVSLADGILAPSVDGSQFAEVPSDAPIDIDVEGWNPRMLKGRASDGREVELHFESREGGDESLDVAVLVDRSGSMACACDGLGRTAASKHQAVARALVALAGQLRDEDRVALWEFDDCCDAVGSGHPAGPAEFAGSVRLLRPPHGGTEIGEALDRVRSVPVRDVLLITDGKSYHLDVHKQALAGRRVFVVLVGEDSLEAKVGHLASLTGGDVHFSFGSDLDRALRACLQGLRSPRAPATVLNMAPGGLLERASAARGSAVVESRWFGEEGEADRDAFSTAVAAYAASLAIAATHEDDARRMAISEGLVTHLTSLCLVDEEAERQQGLPVTRKLQLPTPRADAMYCMEFPSEMRASRQFMMADAPFKPFQRIPDMDGADLEAIAGRIDWNTHGNSLAGGSLDTVWPKLASAIRTLAEDPSLKAAAQRMGVAPLRLAIALVANSVAGESRHAGRVCRRLLRKVDRTMFSDFARNFDPRIGPVQ